jgi:hypothetical protein
MNILSLFNIQGIVIHPSQLYRDKMSLICLARLELRISLSLVKHNSNMKCNYYDIADQKMRKQDSMIGIRLSSEQRLRAEQIIREGRFKNLSEVVRAALREFLKTA